APAASCRPARWISPRLPATSSSRSAPRRPRFRRRGEGSRCSTDSGHRGRVGGIMFSRTSCRRALLAAAAIAAPSIALAVTGTLNPAYGPPLAVQTSQSDVVFLGSPGGIADPSALPNQSLNTELDAAYGYVSGGTLHLFFSGSLFFEVQLEGGITHIAPLDLFIDCAPGGQHQLLNTNPVIVPSFVDLTSLAGLTFDSGFAPDYWVGLDPDPTSSFDRIGAYYATLPSGGGGSGAYLGSTLAGPPGTLSGGANPFGIEMTLDDGNPLGLGHGCGPAAPSAVATGVEWAIPLAALGDPTGCIRVCAFVANETHSQISNQVMGPLPPGTCAMVPAAAMDFSAIPG